MVAEGDNGPQVNPLSVVRSKLDTDDGGELTTVIKRVSEYLANNNIQCKYGFMIAGSYPAALKAKELKGIDLVFNDIDIWIPHEPLSEDFPRDSELKFLQESMLSLILDSHDETAMASFHDSLLLDVLSHGKWTNIPGLPRELPEANFMEIRNTCNVKGLISHFDINAIRVGIQVRHKNGDLRTPIMPEEKDWYVCPTFLEFLEHRILKISQIGMHECRLLLSVLRVGQKSLQMGLQYELPPDSQLEEVLHLRQMKPLYYKKWQKLKEDHVLKRIFSAEELPPTGGREATWWFLCKLHYYDDPKKNSKFRRQMKRSMRTIAESEPTGKWLLRS